LYWRSVATVKKYKDRIELYLSVEEVARAWTEKPSWFKSPVQVAAYRGIKALNIKAQDVLVIETEYTATYFKIIYQLKYRFRSS
jgi:hypothetical protein